MTDRETGGVLLPADRDEKSGDPISEALSSKHPDARVTDPATLHQCEEPPDFADLDITDQVVETAAGKSSRAAGLGSDDGCSLKDLLLRFGKPSADCRKAVAGLACWLSDGTPPWAACRAFLACRTLGMDKCPGARPISIGETIRRLTAKCVIHVAGAEAKNACGTDQLCAGLEAGTEGGTHDITMGHLGLVLTNDQYALILNKPFI